MKDFPHSRFPSFFCQVCQQFTSSYYFYQFYSSWSYKSNPFVPNMVNQLPRFSRTLNMSISWPQNEHYQSTTQKTTCLWLNMAVDKEFYFSFILIWRWMWSYLHVKDWISRRDAQQKLQTALASVPASSLINDSLTRFFLLKLQAIHFLSSEVCPVAALKHFWWVLRRKQKPTVSGLKR